MPSSRRVGPTLCALVLLHGIPVAPLAGQEPDREPGRVLGTVVDAGSGRGLSGVEVRLLEPVNAMVLTNEAGRFAFASVPPGIHEIEVRHIAYGTHAELINVPEDRTVEVRLEVVQEAIDVGELRVQVSIRNPGLEDVGYYDRTRFGFGRFFDQEDLAARSLQGALREVPRLYLMGSGLSHVPVFQRGMGTCVPVIWVDRRLIRLRGAALEDMIDRNNIAAMEVYRPGDTPGEFMYLMGDCGAIVIWTHATAR